MKPGQGGTTDILRITVIENVLFKARFETMPKAMRLGEKDFSYNILEGTARSAGLLLAPVEGFGLQPRLLFPFGQKKKCFTLFVLTLGHFWCSVVTSTTFNSNLSNFDKNPNNPKKNL